MKRWFVGVTLASLAAFVIGLGVTKYRFQSSTAQYAAATFPKYYQSLEEIARDAELVVLGEARSNGTPFKYHDDLLYTSTPVRVLSVLKGQDGPVPSDLQVVEEGGVWEAKDIQWWGTPRVGPGKRYLLFLQKPSMTDPPPNTYILVGAYMGKFEVSAGGQLRYVGPAGEAKGLQEDASTTKLDDLEKRLQR